MICDLMRWVSFVVDESDRGAINHMISGGY